MAAIKVLVNGAKGRMGQEVVKAVQNDPQLILVGEADKEDDLEKIIKASQAEVVVDFTTAASAFENAVKIINAGVHPVIGTSGLLVEQVEVLIKACHTSQLGAIVAPNFALGAVLMMRYAQDCAGYFPDVEIIEMHHANKADAPSGTATRTAEMIAETREKEKASHQITEEKFPGVRGGNYQNIPIHSVRLPGLIAQQTVIFGGLGQTLTITHDTFSREAFMPGVCLACKKVITLKGLVFGLENVL